MAEKVIAANKKAGFLYQILEKWEAGIVLTGQEIKSVREGGVSLKEGYVSAKDGELFLHSVYIKPYKHAREEEHNPTRTRKLLMHKKEINKIIGKIQQKGLTVIPLKIYLNSKGIAKVEIALAKGKKNYDKRKTIKEREAKRAIERAIKKR